MISNKVKNDLALDITLYNATFDLLVKTDEYVDFAAAELSLRGSLEAQLAKGVDPSELRVLFTAGTQAMNFFNKIVTIHNAKEGKTGKSGGKGGPTKASKGKAKATKAAKKATKAKPSATIQQQTIAATLAALEANLNSNFAESKIDSKRKTATQTELAEIERIVIKSTRAIANNCTVISDAISIAKVVKPKVAKPSNGKAERVHAGNRVSKAMENTK